MKAFYDGSVGTDENGDEWITLAAVTGSDDVWAEFDRQWDKMLKSRYPVAPYIHMIQVLDDKDPFERIIGWSEDNKKALIHDAIVLLSHMDKAGFSMVWSTINESARRRWKQHGEPVIADPYAKCAAECSFLAVGGYIQNVPYERREPIYIFYDRGEPFLSSFKNRWLRGRTQPGMKPIDPNNGWDIFREVHEVDLPFHFGLQAADMVAWAHSRALRDIDRPFHYLKKWLLEVVPSQEIKNTEESLRYPDANKDTLWQRIFDKPST
ncbi:MAG: DUF3800 domain-containing protein [Terracidiphilus sp.]|jgi:hypothetical protein